MTVLAAAAPYSMSDFFNNTALGIMRTFADCMSNIGSANMYRGGEMLVVIGPEHAGDIAKDGWSKARHSILPLRIRAQTVRRGAPGRHV